MPEEPKLSVIIPVFNEARYLEEVVARLRALPIDKEILVVDDGSTDGTFAAAQRLDGVCVFHHPYNRGKGAAIRTALPFCRGKLTIIQDADLEYAPDDIIALIDELERSGARAVYGSRIRLRSNKMSYLRYYLGGRLLTAITNLLYGSSLTDEPTCYKLVETGLLQSLSLESERFGFCPEVTAKLLRRGIEIREIPIRYQPRSMAEGKKIRFKDGLEAIWILLRHRFASGPRG